MKSLLLNVEVDAIKHTLRKVENEHIKYAFIIGFEKTLDKADLQRNKNRKWATI